MHGVKKITDFAFQCGDDKKGRLKKSGNKIGTKNNSNLLSLYQCTEMCMHREF